MLHERDEKVTTLPAELDEDAKETKVLEFSSKSGQHFLSPARYVPLKTIGSPNA